jgi:hypothetical protein
MPNEALITQDLSLKDFLATAPIEQGTSALFSWLEAKLANFIKGKVEKTSKNRDVAWIFGRLFQQYLYRQYDELRAQDRSSTEFSQARGAKQATQDAIDIVAVAFEDSYPDWKTDLQALSTLLTTLAKNNRSERVISESEARRG